MTIREYFIDNNYNCSETILRYANDKYGLGISGDALKLVSGFGGGCGCGKICGVLAGSVAVIGVLTVKEKSHEGTLCKTLCGEFCARFAEAFGGSDCAVLKPVYFKEDVRCLHLIEKGAVLLDEFIAEKGLRKTEE